MWHCPNCGTPQVETARCWVCRRSSTTCSTCRHFQRSLTADLGYCGLDPRRRPLTGLELRGCWEERPAAGPPPSTLPAPDVHRLRPGVAARSDAIPRGFVPIELLGTLPASDASGSELVADAVDLARPPFSMAAADEDWSERLSLFGDAEA